MKKKALGVAVVAAMMMTGCATEPPTYLDQAVEQPAPNRYPISIERGKHMLIDAKALYVFLDGAPVATIDGGQTATIYARPGHHIIGVTMHKDKQPDATAAVNVSADHSPILRTNVAALGYAGWKIEHVNR